MATNPTPTPSTDSDTAPAASTGQSQAAGGTPAPVQPEILARGPWPLERISAHWRGESFEPTPAQAAAADAAIAELRARSSPSHDGVAARLVGFGERDGGIEIELQPLRWALRLLPGDASDSVAALCVTRSADGRWLAGRRAPWVASWAGRWALGAGGAVDLGESPADTLVRELQEEWSVAPERVRGEALIRLPHRMIMFVGQAWLAEGAEVVADHEHDMHAWWPADIDDWPPEAGEVLPRMARWLTQ
jgi:8-oxo-dGTP diphosphatase